MVDCGYDSPKSLMKYLFSNGLSLVNSPQALLLTHEHGDHTGGIPALLIAIWEEVNGIVGDCKIGNKRKLEILSANKNLLGKISNDVERDYKGFWNRLKSEGPNIRMRKINPQNDSFGGYIIRGAQTIHGVVNFSYRFESPQGKSFVLSGDGALNEKTRELFQEVDLLVHEGFNVFGSEETNHASIEEVVNYAIEAKIPRVGIVHVNRAERKKQDEIAQLIEKAKTKGIDLFLPEDCQSIEI